MKKIIKIGVFLMVFVLVFVGVPKFNLKAQTDENISYSNDNLAYADLENKEYLYNGVYRFYNNNGITIDYNVYSGIWTFNGTLTTDIYNPPITNINTVGELTAQFIYVGGSSTNTGSSGWKFATSSTTSGRIYFSGSLGGYVKTLEKDDITNNIDFSIVSGAVFNNFQFKLQLEKGDIATEYKVPLQPYLWHEKQLSYNAGYDDGYLDGKIDGYDDGWDAGYDNGYDDGYDDGYDIGYNKGYEDASIVGTDLNLAEWYSYKLYNEYYHITTGNIILDTDRKGITVIVPDVDNVITSVGQGTEQRIIFYDALDNEISSISVYGRLTGRFDYSIPVGAYSFNYYVLVQGPLPSDYVYEWNKVAFVGYKDLLKTYGQAWQEGYDKGYAYGKDDGISIGYADGRDYGYELGKIETIDLYKDEWFQQGKSVGYAEGLDENVATGGFLMILSSAFMGVATLLGIELLPNITIGMIVSVPLVFGILFFILGKRKD